MILDEAHHAPASVFREVLSWLPGKYRFGLTATPERSDGLTPMLDLCIGPELFRIDHQQLVSAGHLVVPRVVPVSTGATTDAETHAAIVSDLASDPDRNRLVVELVAREARAGCSVLVLSGRVDHCQRLAKLITAAGTEAAALTSKVAKHKRSGILDRFRDGSLMVVCATSLADEGLDVSRLERLVLATPARAEGRTIQRLGRLMRPHPGKGTPVLFDLVDDIPLARRQYAARQRAYRKVLGTEALQRSSTHRSTFTAPEGKDGPWRAMSATNSVPVFIDEYKPFDMQRHRKNTLHRYMRRLYTGEVEERGRADQTLVSYRLSAPLCLAGETRPIEPALVERILTANPDKNALQRDPKHERAFRRIKQVNPTLLSTGIIRFLLARDTAADLALAQEMTERLLAGREVPSRVRDNLAVMLLGLHSFEEYAASLGITLPDLPVDAAVATMLDDLLESGGTSVKTGLDYFLEELSVMAVAGTIEHGRHYVYQDGQLALHFGACHAAYCEHTRRTAFEGEVPDRKALRRQVHESQRRGGYVRETDARVCFNGRDDRRRAVIIDIERAKQTLDVDDFPVPEPDAGTGYRDWQKD